jgi:ankyrin repeat protein
MKNTFTQETLAWLELNSYQIDNPNIGGKYGNSALAKASREANISVMRELLDSKVDLEVRNIDGNSVLWNSCFSGSDEATKMLIEADIELDSINDNGVTALMYCASSGKEAMVAMLLEYGADKEIENLDGFRAIDLAVTPKIYKLLRG